MSSINRVLAIADSDLDFSKCLCMEMIYWAHYTHIHTHLIFLHLAIFLLWRWGPVGALVVAAWQTGLAVCWAPCCANGKWPPRWQWWIVCPVCWFWITVNHTQMLPNIYSADLPHSVPKNSPGAWRTFLSAGLSRSFPKDSRPAAWGHFLSLSVRRVALPWKGAQSSLLRPSE